MLQNAKPYFCFAFIKKVKNCNVQCNIYLKLYYSKNFNRNTENVSYFEKL